MINEAVSMLSAKAAKTLLVLTLAICMAGASLAFTWDRAWRADRIQAEVDLAEQLKATQIEVARVAQAVQLLITRSEPGSGLGPETIQEIRALQLENARVARQNAELARLLQRVLEKLEDRVVVRELEGVRK